MTGADNTKREMYAQFIEFHLPPFIVCHLIQFSSQTQQCHAFQTFTHNIVPPSRALDSSLAEWKASQSATMGKKGHQGWKLHNPTMDPWESTTSRTRDKANTSTIGGGNNHNSRHDRDSKTHSTKVRRNTTTTVNINTSVDFQGTWNSFPPK